MALTEVRRFCPILKQPYTVVTGRPATASKTTKHTRKPRSSRPATAAAPKTSAFADSDSELVNQSSGATQSERSSTFYQKSFPSLADIDPVLGRLNVGDRLEHKSFHQPPEVDAEGAVPPSLRVGLDSKNLNLSPQAKEKFQEILESKDTWSFHIDSSRTSLTARPKHHSAVLADATHIEGGKSQEAQPEGSDQEERLAEETPKEHLQVTPRNGIKEHRDERRKRLQTSPEDKARFQESLENKDSADMWPFNRSAPTSNRNQLRRKPQTFISAFEDSEVNEQDAESRHYPGQRQLSPSPEDKLRYQEMLETDSSSWPYGTSTPAKVMQSTTSPHTIGKSLRSNEKERYQELLEVGSSVFPNGYASPLKKSDGLQEPNAVCIDPEQRFKIGPGEDVGMSIRKKAVSPGPGEKERLQCCMSEDHVESWPFGSSQKALFDRTNRNNNTYDFDDPLSKKGHQKRPGPQNSSHKRTPASTMRNAKVSCQRAMENERGIWPFGASADLGSNHMNDRPRHSISRGRGKPVPLEPRGRIPAYLLR